MHLNQFAFTKTSLENFEDIAAPPPPPPLPPQMEIIGLNDTPKPTLKRSPSIRSTATLGGEKMQDELNIVLTMFREKKRNLDIRQTPEVFINQKSNPEEIQEWLEAKDFAPEICQKFKGLSGHQLLSFSRQQLEKVCGASEGKRLYSQLNIQKSVCGVRKTSSKSYNTDLSTRLLFFFQYQTVRSSELKAILAKAREKIETS